MLAAAGGLATAIGSGPATTVLVLMLAVRVLPVAAATVVLAWCSITGRRPGRAGAMLLELVRFDPPSTPAPAASVSMPAPGTTP